MHGTRNLLITTTVFLALSVGGAHAQASSINKATMIHKMAQITGLSTQKSEQAYNAFVDVLTTELKKGSKVSLIDLGTFSARKGFTRQGFNPRTQRTETIPGTLKVNFAPSRKLKDDLQR